MKNVRPLLGFTFQQSDIERFNSMLFKGQSDDCWLWQASLTGRGYGRFTMTSNGKWACLAAHRVAFYLHWRVDPGSNLVCHECDTPRCCNPAHLFVGTQEDNMQDRSRKGRCPSVDGDANPNAVLTSAQVLEIRALRESKGLYYREIAEAYGISLSQAYAVVVRKSWMNT